MTLLKSYTKDSFQLLGITKQGNALTNHVGTNVKVVIKKNNFNKLLMGQAIEGNIVPSNKEGDEYHIFKTLQW